MIGLVACDSSSSGGEGVDAALSFDASSVPDLGPGFDAGTNEDSGRPDSGATDGGVGLEVGSVIEVPLPSPDESFVVGTVGAPRALFGPEATPTFEAAFRAIRAAGFNRFVPYFGLTEGTSTQHFTHFLPPSNVVPQNVSCAGPSNPWAVLPPGLGVTFPAYLTLLDQAVTEVLDRALAEARLREFVERCLGGDPSLVTEAYLYDEPANTYTQSYFDQDPATFQLANVSTLSDAARAVFGRRSLMVEANIPFLLPYLGVPAAEIPIVENVFWSAVDTVAPAADIHLFDHYPIDLTDDFTTLAEYVRHTKTRAPNAVPMFALQAFSYADTGIDYGTPGVGPSRSQARAMAFSVLAEGVRGLYWYGPSTLADDSPYWTDLLELAGEVRRLSGAYALPKVPYDPAPPTLGRATRDGAATYVVLANPTPTPQAATLPLLGEGAVVDGLTGRVLAPRIGPQDPFELGPHAALFLVLVPPGR